jgi:transposase
MITDETRQAILTLYQKGMGIRPITRTLGISRHTVRKIVSGRDLKENEEENSFAHVLPIIRQAYDQCHGNVVRVQEILVERGISIGYSTLTRIVREEGLRETQKKRAGVYTFGPGEEMQHDTSPHRLSLNGKPTTAQCASLVLAYSRRLFVRYYPCFTRFEAKIFLADAFEFMDGVCERVVIDNTSVIVAHGSGPDAQMAPEMEAFGTIFGTKFVPHRIGHADRKARVERNFHYVERNFLAGRSFTDWKDLNEQALSWCNQIANKKPKRSIGISPDEAYVMEKPHLRALPPYVPPIYQTFHRVVDVEGYVSLDTNRYSVPDRLISKKVVVQKHAQTVVVVFDHKKVAEHQRVIGRRDTRVTQRGHHGPLMRERAHSGTSPEEKALLGESDVLDRYVKEIKKRSSGRGVWQLRKLLDLRRTYPSEPFLAALSKALAYGLYDLSRVEKMILDHVAGDFFCFPEEND